MSETSNFENSEHVRSIERAVLGGLMLETERYDSVCLIISHNDFEGKDHQSIFKSMGELVENNKPLDPFTLSDKLDSRNLPFESIDILSILFYISMGILSYGKYFE